MRLPRRAHDAMLERIAAYWQSQLVFVAAKLGVADVLVEGPLTVEEIAARVGAHPPYLKRVLRALASLGHFCGRPSWALSAHPVGTDPAQRSPRIAAQFRIDARR